MLGSDGSRATVAIWVAAALLGGFALLHLAGGRGSDGGAPVRIDRAPASGGRGGGSRGRPAAASTCTSRGPCGSPASCIWTTGARVAEALERAGGPGPRADLAGVNLAARLEDGQQVIVPVRGAGGAAAPRPQRRLRRARRQRGPARQRRRAEAEPGSGNRRAARPDRRHRPDPGPANHPVPHGARRLPLARPSFARWRASARSASRACARRCSRDGGTVGPPDRRRRGAGR